MTIVEPLKAHIWVQDEVIFIQSPPEHEEACRFLPGVKYLKEYKTFRYPATPGVAGAIHASFGENAALYDTGFRSLLKRWYAQTLGERDLSSRWPNLVTVDPWAHQEAAFQFIQGTLGRDDGAAGLFAGMGTGKTLITVAVAVSRRFKRVLVVCPVNKVQDWADDFNNQVQPDAGIVAVPLLGTLEQRAETLRKYPRRMGGPSYVFAANYEAVWQGKLGAQIERESFDLIALDEAQAIKSPGSKVSLFLYRIGQKAPFRLALTGTPSHDKPLDVYGIYRFLDPGIFGTNFDRFRNRYAILQNNGKYMFITGYQNQEELSERMYHIAFRVTEDVLDLPEEVPDIVRRIDLSPSGRNAYEEFKRKLVLERPEGSVAAGNILTKLLRLQQIASGFLPVVSLTDPDADPVLTDVDTTKYEELVRVLTEIDPSEPVAVYAKFKRDLDRIKQAAQETGRGYLEESGRRHEWRTWQRERTGGEVLGLQVDAGSAGIDLTRSAYTVYYSLDYSLGDHDQSRRRTRRPGQTRPCRYIYLLARKTVEEDIYRALKEKRSVADYVVDQLRLEREGA